MSQNILTQLNSFSKKFKYNQEIYSQKCKELVLEEDDNILEMNDLSTNNSDFNENVNENDPGQNFLMKDESDQILQNRDNELNDIVYFDIGGGYFGAAPEGLDLTGRPKYEDYANIVVDSVEKSVWFNKCKPFIVIEPGSSVVSNVFKYYTKVYQIKHIGDKSFAMVDGTVFDVKPTMHSNNLPHIVISDTEGGIEEVYDVVGSTCMEKDVILKDVPLKGLKAGDYIEIRGVGAYTICLTPTFINYLAPIVSIEKDGIKVVRRRQQLEDILTPYER